MLLVLIVISAGCANDQAQSKVSPKQAVKDSVSKEEPVTANKNYIDTALYNKLQLHIANGDSSGLWPVKGPLPLPGAILPFNRIVSYYGNLYSTQMGALGEFPKDSMLRRLQGEVKKWTAADSLIPAIPALHYIAITAQNEPGKAGAYRLRMPFSQIDTILNWAKEINALVFVDVQVGLSTIQKELPEFDKYLALPNFHFGIDPEFSMKTGARPGSRIGTYDAADINFVIEHMAAIVRKNNLPPKVLVIHRFTRDMVTNYKKIKLVPEVQVVMDMDGWGGPAKKEDTYKAYIYSQPVQFTGFKIFYKNDTQRVGEKVEMQPADVLKLTPAPVYIQYQ
ncbi:MAG TPA: hypothetical protein VM888_00040 [Chitinophagaceae bacterium]|nr:hypothetical protein [Chitinophagaceae bacterium]